MKIIYGLDELEAVSNQVKNVIADCDVVTFTGGDVER